MKRRLSESVDPTNDPEVPAPSGRTWSVDAFFSSANLVTGCLLPHLTDFLDIVALSRCNRRLHEIMVHCPRTGLRESQTLRRGSLLAPETWKRIDTWVDDDAWPLLHHIVSKGIREPDPVMDDLQDFRPRYRHYGMDKSHHFGFFGRLFTAMGARSRGDARWIADELLQANDFMQEARVHCERRCIIVYHALRSIAEHCSRDSYLETLARLMDNPLVEMHIPVLVAVSAATADAASMRATRTMILEHPRYDDDGAYLYLPDKPFYMGHDAMCVILERDATEAWVEYLDMTGVVGGGCIDVLAALRNVIRCGVGRKLVSSVLDWISDATTTPCKWVEALRECVLLPGVPWSKVAPGVRAEMMHRIQLEIEDVGECIHCPESRICNTIRRELPSLVAWVEMQTRATTTTE